MSKKVDIALKMFRNNYNSAQAVISAFAPDVGIDLDCALKIACPFGAGIARLQNICSAITGALMIIGFKYGMDHKGDLNTKEISYILASEFIEKFKKKNGDINCRKLLGIDMNTEEGKKLIEQKVHLPRCEKLLTDAVKILAHILGENN